MNDVNTPQTAPALAQEEQPQKVFEKKKTIIRANQIIWYIVGLVEVLLVFRFVMKILGASQSSSFTNIIYSITTPLTQPFTGILGVYTFGNSIFDWSTVIAGIVYLCVAWGLVYFFELIYPISTKDVEK
ncbi:MAG: YggT family protein [Pseudomonadales bacterium]|nr:YggT family protein [Pseudomonadales bacterium]